MTEPRVNSDTPALLSPLLVLQLATAALLALFVCFSPSPLLPLLLVAVPLLLLMLWNGPYLVLLGLLALYPFYMLLHSLVLIGLPPIAGTALAGMKELALAAAFGVALMRYGERLQLLSWHLRFTLFAFAALLLILAAVAPVSKTAALLEVRYHLEYILLLPLGAMLVRDAERLRTTIGLVLIAGALLAVGWLSVIGWAGLGALSYAAATTRTIFGTNEIADAINALGTYMAFLVALLLGLLAFASNWRRRFLYSGLALLCSWALLASFSRRSIGGVVLSALCVAILGRRWRVLAWGSAAAAVVGVFASGPLINRLSISTMDSTGGVSLRLSHIRFTLEHLNPLTALIGHGVGTMGFVPFNAGVKGAIDLHGYYLVLLYETGIVGLLLYLGVACAALLALYRRSRYAEEEPFSKGVIVGAIAALVAFLAEGLLGTSNAALPVAPVLWLVVGVALVAPIKRGVS